MYPFSCGIVAADLAKLHRKQGGDPIIVGLKGQPVDKIGNTRPIIPKHFDTITWGTHLVCVNADIAYDPIIGTPLELEAYLEDTFIERPEIGRTFRSSELAQFTSNRSRRTMIDDVRDSAPFVVITDVSMLQMDPL